MKNNNNDGVIRHNMPGATYDDRYQKNRRNSLFAFNDKEFQPDDTHSKVGSNNVVRNLGDQYVVRSPRPYLLPEIEIVRIKNSIAAILKHLKTVAYFLRQLRLQKGVYDYRQVMPVPTGKLLSELLPFPSGEEQQKAIYAIACKLQEIHGRKVVHGDLKSDNMFYDEENNIVTFIDWDRACEVNKSTTRVYRLQ